MSIKDFIDCMPHTITHKPLTGRNDYGKETFGTATSYVARVVQKPHNVTDPQGIEVVAKGEVWVGPKVGDVDSALPTIGVTDQITLPDGRTPTILAVDTYPDEVGDHHLKVHFG